MLIPSIIVLFVMYFAAIIASYVPVLQIDFVRYFGGENSTVWFGLNGVEMSFLLWITILMIYVYIASTLPVWKLLQPRDFINSHQLILGLVILYLGLFIMSPEITAPTTNQSAGDVSWFPLLFITIACGAISGFHGLVSSGTTAKQLDNETDARFIGYLGAIGEGSLALITIVAVVTYFNTTGEFLDTYHSFASAGASGLNIFCTGCGTIGNSTLHTTSGR